jgi:Ulp1 family protease
MKETADFPQLPDLNKDLLAIPIIVKGTFRDHVMMVMVDKIAKRIEFYDPKGLTVQDRASNVLTNFPEYSLKEFMGKICDAYAKDDTWSIAENTVRHQSDGYNCGVYVSDYLKRRSEGISFEAIRDNGLSFAQASNTARLEMMNTIIDKFPS